jgi:hypothetical protein
MYSVVEDSWQFEDNSNGGAVAGSAVVIAHHLLLLLLMLLLGGCCYACHSPATHVFVCQYVVAGNTEPP